MSYPLNYDFGFISIVYKVIYEQSIKSGLHVHWTGTPQTLQLYRNEDAYLNNETYIGAIQYEGSNNFEEKAPEIVSWRFKRSNLANPLRIALENISDFRNDRNTGPKMNPESESIAFKFKTLNDEAYATIIEIGNAIKSVNR